MLFGGRLFSLGMVVIKEGGLQEMLLGLTRLVYGSILGKLGGSFLAICILKLETALVITPFLPTGFSRVSARKTGQPGPSQHGPTKPRRIKYSHEEGPGHISQGLTKFD